ncbi:hypothetical protein [Citreimonas salinaria]|uniref:Uncharacterized protein n=1 Tax=Citreimonas salinaria TaxID=321339 RepID=A0A1H3KUJ2_9RHOB|nr:hypothetical protein [Citreimonas salinaria]SDY55315.1 hypothetical protein SAMN05444340_11094 [Citreimonas salinaria]
MAALTAGRLTPRREGDVIAGAVAATVLLHVGALVMRNAAGYVTPGATATGLVGVGIAEAEADNAAGAAGDVTARIRTGVFRFDNSAATDAITSAEIGDVCFAVDDQTVAKTDGTATRSPAGIVTDVDAQGVWVRLDEALTLARTGA